MADNYCCFGQQIRDSIEKFLIQEKLNFSGVIEHIARLATLLISYKEEGRAIHPTIVFTSDINQIRPVLQIGQIVRVGRRAVTGDLPQRILKECATLCRGNWSIFVENFGADWGYGVFAYEHPPLSITVEEVLESNSDDHARFVLIRRQTDKRIDILGSQRNRLVLDYSSTSDAKPSNHVEELAKVATAKVEESSRASAQRYVAHCLRQALQDGHGSLIVVVDADDNGLPECISDRILLDPPVSLSAAVAQYERSEIPTAEGLGHLNRCSTLLTGMLHSDGIVAISNRAEIRAYRCFAKTSSADGGAAIGGARLRTYNYLRGQGTAFRAVFFRSSDGHSLMEAI